MGTKKMLHETKFMLSSIHLWEKGLSTVWHTYAPFLGLYPLNVRVCKLMRYDTCSAQSCVAVWSWSSTLWLTGLLWAWVVGASQPGTWRRALLRQTGNVRPPSSSCSWNRKFHSICLEVDIMIKDVAWRDMKIPISKGEIQDATCNIDLWKRMEINENAVYGANLVGIQISPSITDQSFYLIPSISSPNKKPE